MSGLPKGWVETPIENIVEFNPKHDRAVAENIEISFVPMPAVSEHTGQIVSSESRPASAVLRGYTHFQNGDVLFAKITPCMENGKAAVARSLINGLGCGSTEFHVMRPAGAVEAGFLWRFVRQRRFRTEAEGVMTGAVGQRRVPTEFLKSYPFPLPPLSEQRRIVAKLDALDASSKRARADLDRIPALVARAKQAILAKAFRGELTSDFRAAHRHAAAQSHAGTKLEIENKRREVWRSWQSEQNLRRSYKQPQDVDWTPGFDLPEGWHWRSVDQLCAASQYGSSAKTNEDPSGVPVLRMGNIQDGRLNFSNLKFLPQTHAEFPELMLKKGDLLFNRTNSPELVGKTAVFEGFSRPCSFASYLIRLRVAAYQPQLLAAYLNSSIGRLWVKSVVTQQVGQANVNGTKLAGLAVPFMPEDEQVGILRRIESAFAKIDRIAAEAASASKLLARLDQALLSKAFRGELVPQDPGDEPASALLERIQAARAAAPSPKRTRKTKDRAP